MSSLPFDISNHDGSHTYSVDACGLDGGDPKTFKYDTSLSCARWDLVSLHNSSSGHDLSAWLITVLSAEPDKENADRPFVGVTHTAQTLMCTPSISQGRGLAQLFDEDDWFARQRYQGDVRTSPDRLNGFRPQSLVKHDERDLDASYTRAFDQILDGSLGRNRTRPAGYTLPGAVVSPHFIGDTLGHILLRSLQTQRESADSTDAVQATVSHIYGILFASTAVETDWLFAPQDTTTNITVLRWIEEFRVRKAVLYSFVALSAVLMAGVVCLGFVPRRYLFPLAPELLENSLAFLYQSSIIDTLTQIEHPEELSMDELHEKIEAIGGKYIFGRYCEDGKHYEGYGIDRVEEFSSQPSHFQHVPVLRGVQQSKKKGMWERIATGKSTVALVWRNIRARNDQNQVELARLVEPEDDAVDEGLSDINHEFDRAISDMFSRLYRRS